MSNWKIWKGKEEKKKLHSQRHLTVEKENIAVSYWNSIFKYFKVSETQNTIMHYLCKVNNKGRDKESPRGN